MRNRLAALACCLVIMFSSAAVTATAAEAVTVQSVAASSCPGNFFSRLGLLVFQRSYASYIWLRYC